MHNLWIQVSVLVALAVTAMVLHELLHYGAAWLVGAERLELRFNGWRRPTLCYFELPFTRKKAIWVVKLAPHALALTSAAVSTLVFTAFYGLSSFGLVALLFFHVSLVGYSPNDFYVYPRLYGRCDGCMLSDV